MHVLNPYSDLCCPGTSPCYTSLRPTVKFLPWLRSLSMRDTSYGESRRCVVYCHISLFQRGCVCDVALFVFSFFPSYQTFSKWCDFVITVSDLPVRACIALLIVCASSYKCMDASSISNITTLCESYLPSNSRCL